MDMIKIGKLDSYTRLETFERWMVRSNISRIRAGEDAAEVVARLRENGYVRVATAVEEAMGDTPVYPVTCPSCKGTGGGVYNDCPTCDGNGVVG
jgi:hypothetical protein